MPRWDAGSNISERSVHDWWGLNYESRVVKDGDVEEFSSPGIINQQTASNSYDIIPGLDVSYEGEK